MIEAIASHVLLGCVVGVALHAVWDNTVCAAACTSLVGVMILMQKRVV